LRNIKHKLVEIRDKILGLKLIYIELDNEDDAYIIFETLNTRSKELSVSDLVKNHLTKFLKPKVHGVYTTKIKWEEIVSKIEGSSTDISVDGFLHHYWLSKYDYVTIKNLFKEVKKEIKKSKAEYFINDLLFYADIYRLIHEPNLRNWKMYEKSIQNSLDALLLLRVKQQIPMVLSLLFDYEKEKLNKKNVEKTLNAIENFHFIFTAITSQRSSGGISQMYASFAKLLNNSKKKEDKIDFIYKLIRKLKDKIPSFQEFEANFKEIRYTRTYSKQKNLVKYILSRIDAHFNKGVVVDYSGMTIEHLASQSDKKFDNETIGQLGNLILVPPELNNKLGDSDFRDKKMILSDAKVFLDPIISGSNQWESAEIENRTIWLAQTAFNEIWSLKH
jgi:hypothetical protein